MSDDELTVAIHPGERYTVIQDDPTGRRITHYVAAPVASDEEVRFRDMPELMAVLQQLKDAGVTNEQFAEFVREWNRDMDSRDGR